VGVGGFNFNLPVRKSRATVGSESSRFSSARAS